MAGPGQSQRLEPFNDSGVQIPATAQNGTRVLIYGTFKYTQDFTVHRGRHWTVKHKSDIIYGIPKRNSSTRSQYRQIAYIQPTNLGIVSGPLKLHSAIQEIPRYNIRRFITVIKKFIIHPYQQRIHNFLPEGGFQEAICMGAFHYRSVPMNAGSLFPSFDTIKYIHRN